MTSSIPARQGPGVEKRPADRYNGAVKRARRAAAGRLVIAAALVVGFSVAAARAELVVLDDGRVVKAASTRVAGDSLEIRLLGGGSFSVDRARVERVVEDEVAPGDMPPPRVVAETLAPRPQARHADAVPPPPQPFLAPAAPKDQPDQGRGREERPKGGSKNNGGKQHKGNGH